jgi:pimeloyl-ACP methyl ester carboxylesterase
MRAPYMWSVDRMGATSRWSWRSNTRSWCAVLCWPSRAGWGIWSPIHQRARKPSAHSGRALAPARQAALAGDSDAATRHFFEAVAGQPGLWETLSEDRRQLMLPNGRMLRLFFSIPRTNISCDQLGQVRAPTLIVKGDRSIPMFQLFSDAVAGCMPGSQVAVIPNSGHGMSQQNPAAFNKALPGIPRAELIPA